MLRRSVLTMGTQAALGALLSRSRPAEAALIPPFFLDAVVAIGFSSPSQVPVGAGSQTAIQSTWFTEGTGFLYGNFVSEDKVNNTKTYQIYLVTAAHVIREHPVNQELAIRINSKDPTKAPQFTIPLHPPAGSAQWLFGQGEADVAAIQLDFPRLAPLGLEMDYFRSDDNTADAAKMKSLGITAGDDVFVLGFPMNLAGKERNYAIVRRGVIARDSDLLDGSSETYMIDALVFPGNSGGPVVLRPEVVSITGTPSQGNALLLGLVVSYTPFNDIAVSQQTHQARVIFQENSGLATVIPVDAIEKVIRAAAPTASVAPVAPSQPQAEQPAH